MKLINFLMNNPCQDPNILKVILFIRKIMEVAFIAIPIVLIVLITFDFVKSVMAGTEDVQKKNVKIVIKRLIYAVMVFFVLPIVNIVFGAFVNSGEENAGLIGEEFGVETVNYLTCWTNAKEDLIEEFEKTVTFDGNGGNVYGEAKKTCGGKEVCQITNLPRATKKGYKFYGWSLSKEEECSKYPNGIYLYDKETTYYACYASEGNEPVEEDVTPDLEKLQNESVEKSKAAGFWWPIEKADKNLATYSRGYSSDHLGYDIKSITGIKGIIDIIAVYDGVVDTVWNDIGPEYDGMHGKPGAKDPKLHDGYGNGVIIKHNYKGKTIYSYYAHMTQDIKVKKGDKVTAGTILGKMGNSANSSGTHLHFELRYGSKDRGYKKENNPDNYFKEGKYPTK